MRKKVFGILVICLLISLSAFAADDFTAEVSGGVLRIYGTMTENASKLGIAILKPGTEDLEGITGENATDKIWVLDEAVSPAGEVEFSYPLEGSPSGVYKIILAYDPQSTRTLYAAYYDENEIPQIIAELVGAPASEIYELLYSYRYLYGIDLGETSAYHRLLGANERQAVLNKMAEASFSTPQNVKEEFLRLVCLQGLAVADKNDPEFVENVRELLAPSLENIKNPVILELNSNVEAFKFVCEAVTSAPYANIAALEKDLTEKTALALFKVNDSRTLRVLAEKYNDIYGFDFEGAYKDLGSYRDNVFLQMAGERSKIDKEYTISRLRTAFNEAVKKVRGDLSKQPGGTSPGGRSLPDISAPAQTAVAGPQINPPALKYTDLSPDHWGYGAVNALEGIIDGFEDKSFRPDAEVTRAQLVKMLVLYFDIEPVRGNAFLDVDENHWANAYVFAAVRLGLVKGISEEVFGEALPVTRQDAAVMLYRFMEHKGYSAGGGTARFSDDGDIAPYAKDAVGELAAAGIINGTGEGRFMPAQAMTRVQAAQLLYNFAKGAEQE